MTATERHSAALVGTPLLSRIATIEEQGSSYQLSTEQSVKNGYMEVSINGAQSSSTLDWDLPFNQPSSELGVPP